MIPQAQSCRLRGVVCLAAYDISRPILGNGDPIALGEKERRVENIATDFRISANLLGSVLFHSLFERDVVRNTVLLPEGIPCHPRGKSTKAYKEASTDDEVRRGVKLKEEWDARLKE